jgi:gamma-glutamylcyclotransferase (GGCT)/AIG2-like uncharacterized protein YtfP
MTPGSMPAITAVGWSAIGQCLLGGSAFVGGGWAVFTYRKARRREAARWLQGIFNDFYTNPNLIAGRELIEYDYCERLETLLNLRVTARYVPLSQTEREDLRQLDLVLNHLEQLIYLEEEKHIAREDREVFFQYWFDLLGQPDKASLRRYLVKCGYEKCSRLLDIDPTEYVAFYGTLMNEFDSLDELHAREQLRLAGPCTIEGRLFDMGEWPSLTLGDGTVKGELFEVLDREVFRKLDPFERYDPTQRDQSGYLRRCVRLVEPAVDAWLYVANEAVTSQQLIQSGSWYDHMGVQIGTWR